MPAPEIEGVETFDIEDGRRLVLAIWEDMKCGFMTVSDTGANTAGRRPEEIIPEAEWIERPY